MYSLTIGASRSSSCATTLLGARCAHYHSTSLCGVGLPFKFDLAALEAIALKAQICFKFLRGSPHDDASAPIELR